MAANFNLRGERRLFMLMRNSQSCLRSASYFVFFKTTAAVQTAGAPSKFCLLRVSKVTLSSRRTFIFWDVVCRFVSSPLQESLVDSVPFFTLPFFFASTHQTCVSLLRATASPSMTKPCRWLMGNAADKSGTESTNQFTLRFYQREQKP